MLKKPRRYRPIFCPQCKDTGRVWIKVPHPISHLAYGLSLPNPDVVKKVPCPLCRAGKKIKEVE